MPKVTFEMEDAKNGQGVHIVSNPSLSEIQEKAKSPHQFTSAEGYAMLCWSAIITETQKIEGAMIKNIDNNTILEPLHWTCHICGKYGHDANIGVTTEDISAEHDLEPGIMYQNVRYCKDDPDCVEKAKHFRFLPAKVKS
jgi:hypothetical protein